MGKRWSSEEIGFLRENWGVVSTIRIAEKLGRSIPSVRQKASQWGLEKPLAPELVAEEEPEVEIKEEPEPIGEIAAYGNRPDGSWKGKLGWEFSAEDCEHDRRMLEEAARFFTTYGSGRAPRSQEGETLPYEMTAMQVEVYLKVKKGALNFGVATGYLPVHYDEGNNVRKYYTRDLLRYRSEMIRQGKWDSWKV